MRLWNQCKYWISWYFLKVSLTILLLTTFTKNHISMLTAIDVWLEHIAFQHWQCSHNIDHCADAKITPLIPKLLAWEPLVLKSSNGRDSSIVCLHNVTRNKESDAVCNSLIPTSAAVTAVSSQLRVPSSTSWSYCNPPSNFVNGHVNM